MLLVAILTILMIIKRNIVNIVTIITIITNLTITRVRTPNLHCFKAGDARVNEQPALATLHTLWLRCLFIIIYPSHGYTALVADEICKNYQAILVCWSSLGTYRCM